MCFALGCGPTHAKASSPTTLGDSGSPAEGGGATACAPGQPLAGATYDITRSRFSFGSTPVPVDAGSLVRWTGPDGVVGVFADGSELASLDANAPEANLPGYAGDASTVAALARDYFGSMGVQSCQILSTDETATVSGGGSVDGGSFTTSVGPTIVELGRGIDGIRVVESLAVAQFDVDGKTTSESFYWPEIPAEVVSAAIAFQERLAAPGALAAYKGMLPEDARGDGHVVIHHHVAGSPAPFTAVATYDTVQLTPEDDGGDLNFDENGVPVADTWSSF